MPVFTERTPSISFQLSSATDLFWELCATTQRQDGTRCAPEILTPLAERVAAFWSEDASDCFAELIVLAHHGGVLLGDVERGALVEGVRAACTSAPPRPRLATETDEERQAIWGRLAVLRADAERREAYLRLLDDVWAEAEGNWRNELDRCAAVLQECQERARRHQPWRDLFKKQQMVDELVKASIERAEDSPDDVVVAVCAFGGTVILDLEGLQFVGLAVAPVSADARARAAAPARRFRALSDPTRLALLEMVAHSPSSVGALARELGVSQPTVSNHVKLLVEAGLVTSSRSDRRSVLVIDDDGVDRMLAEAAALLRRA